MTAPTPPPETAPETTEAPHKFQRRRLGEILGVGPNTSFAAMCGVVRQVLAERDHLREEAVETVEHRVVGTGPSGFQHESRVNLWIDYDDWSERTDWTGVRYESRTVRTWTSGWSPVPDTEEARDDSR